MSGPSGLCAIFLDANVLRFAIFEQPALTKQTVRWGNCDITLEVAIAPVPSRARFEGREAWLQYEIDCLPRLGELVRLGRYRPYINTELDFELAWLPFGALISSDLSAFRGVRFWKAPDPFPYSRIVASSSHTRGELDVLREHVFAADFDQRFNDT
jgi:hypothetical protein